MLAPIRNNPKAGKAALEDAVVDLVLVPRDFGSGLAHPLAGTGRHP